MALTITNQISGQQASDTLTYSFLYEPLKIYITDSDPTVSEIYCDITRLNTVGSGDAVPVKIKYIVRDISSLGGISVDLSKVMIQMHDFDTYNFQSMNNVIAGWDSVMSKYIYKFDFYTNQSATKTEILKLPIIGGRSFANFVPAVDHNTPIQEISNSDLINSNLKGYTIVDYTLKDISLVTNSNYSPNSSLVSVTTGTEPCEGVIHWKSKLGGWQSWGMNLANIKNRHAYEGSITIGMFESTSSSGGGDAYIPVDYTGVSSSFSISLKSLSISADILKGLAEINGTPTVYYQPTPTSRLELMRLTSATAPVKSLIQGGDFSVSLKGISKTKQRVK